MKLFRKFLAPGLFLAVAAEMGPTALLAQTSEAQITGIVKDKSGGVIPGAEAKIENPAAGVTRLTVTDEEGRYLFRSLPPAVYTLVVNAPRFKTKTVKDLELHVAQQARLDIELEVGQPGETVTVTEVTPLLQAE